MNILRILAFRLGMVTIALVLPLGAKIASAETIQVGQYFAEVRGLASQSSALHIQSSQITGLKQWIDEFRFWTASRIKAACCRPE